MSCYHALGSLNVSRRMWAANIACRPLPVGICGRMVPSFPCNAPLVDHFCGLSCARALLMWQHCVQSNSAARLSSTGCSLSPGCRRFAIMSCLFMRMQPCRRSGQRARSDLQDSCGCVSKGFTLNSDPLVSDFTCSPCATVQGHTGVQCGISQLI